MNGNQTSLDWNFWRRWVLLSTLGYGIGGVVGLFLAVFAGWFLPYPAFAILGGVVAGTMVGLVLWEAVRLKAVHTHKLIWLGGHIVGLAISWTLIFWVVNSMENAFLGIGMIGVLWGLLFATIQWLTLREQIHRAAIRFILNGLSGVVVFIVGWGWPTLFSGHTFDSGVGVDYILYLSILGAFVFWPIAGFLGGVITGSTLIWLSGQPDQPDELNKPELAK